MLVRNMREREAESGRKREVGKRVGKGNGRG